MQQVRGVIAKAKGEPVSIETINIPDPGPGEAVVAIQACGVCHTDLHYREGGLMAEKERELVVDAALAVVQVGVADPAGLHVDDRLPRARVGHENRLDGHRRTLAAGDDALHLVWHPASLGADHAGISIGSFSARGRACRRSVRSIATR